MEGSLLSRFSRAFILLLVVKGLNSFCGPRARRFSVCCINSCVVFGGGLFGLVANFAVFPPYASLIGVFFAETCGLALHRCL